MVRFAAEVGYADNPAALYNELQQRLETDSTRINAIFMSQGSVLEAEKARLRDDLLGEELDLARPTPVTELLSNFLSFTQFEPFYRAMRERAEIMALYKGADPVESAVGLMQS